MRKIEPVACTENDAAFQEEDDLEDILPWLLSLSNVKSALISEMDFEQVTLHLVCSDHFVLYKVSVCPGVG